MGSTEVITIPYCPRVLQAAVHKALKRFNVIVCHRRWGKTVFAINELIRTALTLDKKRPRCAYIAPFKSQAKEIVWDFLYEYASVVPGAVFNQQELRVDFPNGGRVKLFGADNVDALRGIYLDGVVLDEYAQMSRRLWGQVIRPTLADRKGWGIFIGTPMGHNAFYDLFKKASERKNWSAKVYKASETGVLDEDELADAKDEMDEDEYMQEFECSWEASLKGSYYGKELEKAEKDERITSVPYQQGLPVHTAWDLGISTGNETAIWFYQQAGMEIHVIDYYEASNEGLMHYIDLINDKDYSYGDHYAPHDIEARELTNGTSRKDTAYDMGINFRVLELASIADGIHAAKMLFSRIWFDAEKCKQGIEALRNYRRDYDDKRGVFRSHPLHDWSSNGADAFRYLAMGHEKYRNQSFKRKVKRATSWNRQN